MEEFFASFKRNFDESIVSETLRKVNAATDNAVSNVEILKKIFSCIDLTTLSSEDSISSVSDFCNKVNLFESMYPNIPSVGAVCVFPVFAPVVASRLTAKGVNKAVVAGGFPASQTFTDIKVKEIERSVELGADEVDVVIPIGEFLNGNYEFVLDEVRTMKDAAGGAHLKVILETGILNTSELIWKASLLAMEGGADFIKTSTGKVPVSATPEASVVMLSSIASFYQQTGKRVGFKAAGGIVNTRDAVMYYSLVNELLNSDWLSKELFRIGASRLTNNLLTDIQSIETGSNVNVKYF